MLSIRQTFRKAPLPLLILCGLEKLGLLLHTQGLKNITGQQHPECDILFRLFLSRFFLSRLSSHFSLGKQRQSLPKAHWLPLLGC